MGEHTVVETAKPVAGSKVLVVDDDAALSEMLQIVLQASGFETGWAIERMPCELPHDCRVLGNLNCLAQALENILRNAIRHSPEGGVVRLAGRREGEQWLLWVEDQGPGVAESELKNIFRPFTRLSAARPGGGWADPAAEVADRAAGAAIPDAAGHASGPECPSAATRALSANSRS